ncbi:MAG: EamA family transporter [Deltaproteobacteria bacterium]
MFKIIILVLIAEIFTATGHVFFKKAANALEFYDFRSIASGFGFLSAVLKRPSVWIGFLAMAAGLVVWLVALAEGELSVVFPLGSIQFILVLFSAHTFLNERISPAKLLGTLLVVSGIILITKS